MDLSGGVDRNEARGSGKFETTRWTVVIAAGRGSREALRELCAAYWCPIYTFFRRSRDPDEARDLTQGFFARLLEKDDIAAADETRGRFRNWLLKSASNYRANEADRKKAQKRGGGIEPLSMDIVTAEGHYLIEPADDLTPEQIYERHWALTLLDRTLSRLEEEHAARAQAPLFEKLKLCLLGDNEQKQHEMARELGMEPGNFRQCVHRCKIRFGELLGEEVAQTVSTEGDVEEELRFLREVLRSRSGAGR